VGLIVLLVGHVARLDDCELHPEAMTVRRLTTGSARLGSVEADDSAAR
jgi:hypothetical protein